MTGAPDFRRRLRALLDGLYDEDRCLEFWWRDDDATVPSPVLDRLLAIAGCHGVPLALAVIPDPSGPALAERLTREGGAIAVFQHGFAHANHAPTGEKATELGTHRPVDIVLDELSRGREKLQRLFADRFLPVLTPPWNRIGDEVVARRGEAGLVGLSTFATMHVGDPDCVNTHVDIIDWKGGRRFAGYGKMLAVLEEEIEQRRSSEAAPLGLLTHHLDHDEEAWEFLEAFLSAAAHHPAACWPVPAALFNLDRAA